MNKMHVEPSLLCDYITSKNGYCKHVMTSTAENYAFLKITKCTKNEDERTMHLCF